MTRLFEAKPYIIAEVGSNWRTLADCLESIRVAKECGADAVKFQIFTADALWGLGPKDFVPACEDPVVRIVTELPAGKPAKWVPQLPTEWLPKLAEASQATGLEFACTAFSPELVRAVDPYVSWHKVASSDAAWPQMLEAVARTGKPVLLSTGAKSRDEIAMAVKYLEIHGAKERTVGLYCVASYPADYVELLELIGNGLRGFSDHTLGYTAAVEAARRGVIVIEKHFTAFPELDTPDRPHSLTPAQFAAMVNLIHTGEPPEQERDMFLRHNRRLIATQDIAPGTVLKYGENYGAYRSLVDDTRGASPFDWEKVEGRMAKGPIARGKGIAVGDVE